MESIPIKKKIDEPNPITAIFKSIQIALDEYDDIFSDFDASPFSKRILSEDFLKELKSRHVETPKGDFEVTFTLPDVSRNEKVEAIVRKRLKEYFRLKKKETEHEIKERTKNGVLKIAGGIVIFIGIFQFAFIETAPVTTTLSVLAWYLLWSGYERIFEIPRALENEEQFNLKFSKARYYFLSEEDAIRKTEKIAEEETEGNIVSQKNQTNRVI